MGQESVPCNENQHQPSVLDPIASNFQLFQHETPKQPPIPSLQSTLDRQFGLEQNAAHYGDGASLASAVDSDPVLRRSGVAPDQIATVTTTTSIPRTPRCALRAIPHHVHRPRAKPRAYSLYGTTRSIRPLLRPLPGPNVLKMPFTKPFSKPLPSPPSSDAPGTLCSRPLSFETLPLEIKHMIYRELLVSKQPIRKPHKLVCNKRSIMLDSVQPVKDIDSSILRVSRTVYQEALPVLYGKNTFEFCKPRKLRDFSHAGLDRSHTRKQPISSMIDVCTRNNASFKELIMNQSSQNSASARPQLVVLPSSDPSSCDSAMIANRTFGSARAAPALHRLRTASGSGVIGTSTSSTTVILGISSIGACSPARRTSSQR